MKKTKRNNRRLKGGSNRSSNNSTKKNDKCVNDKCVIEFYETKVKWRDNGDRDSERNSLVRGRSPPYSTDGLPRPGFKYKHAPQSIKNFNKKQYKQEQRGSLQNNTYINQSKKYYLSYDKKPIPRCKESHESACEIENKKNKPLTYFIEKTTKKSKGGKKSSYKSRKSGKKMKK